MRRSCPSNRRPPPWTNETGMVLPLALMALLVLAALVAALLGLGSSEPQIAANLVRGHQALDLAEAGLERAIASFIQTPPTVNDASCSPCPGPPVPLWTAAPLAGVGTYTVSYQALADHTLSVQSVGRATGGAATRTARTVVTTAFSTRDAILADNVNVSGSARIDGSLGGIHANSSASLTGSGWVAETATSSGTTCSGCSSDSHVGDPAGSGAGTPVQAIPEISASKLKASADYILGDGMLPLIQIVATGEKVFPASGKFTGWMPMPKSVGGKLVWQWKYSGAGTPLDGTYYAESLIEIASSPGNPAAPWHATFVVGTGPGTGTVSITGHPTIVPAGNPQLGDVVIVADGLVDINGTGGSASISGTIASGGNVDLDGAVSIAGNIVARGTVSTSGSTSVVYNSGTKTPFTILPPRAITWSTTP